MYTCPMHSDVSSQKEGRCSKCGMKLVKNPKQHQTNDNSGYAKLAIIIALISLVSLSISIVDFSYEMFSLQKLVGYFMAGFFITFSGFKLLDLKGFAEGYKTYDLLAIRLPSYGYLYPFIELFFGLSMIIFPTNKLILIVEVLIMAFSGFGVLLKILKRERFTCSCLGTFLNVPLTKVTLIENFGMALLGLFLILSQ